MEPLATYLRSHPHIDGLQVGKSYHTISLFADDIILLMLTNVETSLASVHWVLQEFNGISYYKVNKLKSYILNMGIPTKRKQKLVQQFPYMWNDDGIKYLGITLTPKLKDLIKTNYTPFLNTLSPKLDKFARAKLSWTGRLAAFKMQILPQLLYLFRALPIPLPNSYFSSLHSILSKYLWQGKRARSAFDKLIKHRKAGGVGHVQLQDYYFTAIFSQLQHWLLPSSNALWVDLEQSQIPQGPYMTFY